MESSSSCNVSDLLLANVTDCMEQFVHQCSTNVTLKGCDGFLENCREGNSTIHNLTMCRNSKDSLDKSQLQTSSQSYLMLNIFVALGVIASNAILVAAVKRLRHRRIDIHYWIFQLAMTDIVMGLLIIVRAVLQFLFLLSQLGCRLIQCILMIIVYVSMCAVFGMSVVSYSTLKGAAVSQPLVKKGKMKTLCFIVAIWVFWSMISIVTFATQIGDYDQETEGCHAFNSAMPKWFLIVLGITTLLLMLGTVLFQFGIAYQIKRRQRLVTHHPDAHIRRDDVICPSGQVGNNEALGNTLSIGSSKENRQTERQQGRVKGRMNTLAVPDPQIPGTSYQQWVQGGHSTPAGHHRIRVMPRNNPKKGIHQPKSSLNIYSHGERSILRNYNYGRKDHLRQKKDGLLSIPKGPKGKCKTTRNTQYSQSKIYHIDETSLSNEETIEMGTHPTVHSRTLRNSSAIQRSTQLTLHSIKCVTMVIGLFVLCFLPWNIALFLTASCDLRSCTYLSKVHEMSRYALALNSIMNVFVWAKKSGEFSRVIKQMIRCPCSKRTIFPQNHI